ncbi:MAG: sensor histidine kinase [Pseudomonadota bacterium]
MNRHADAVRQAERQRIARDIHDDLGQSLLALKIELGALQASSAGSHPLFQQQLGSLAGNVDHAIHALRDIIDDLHPLAPGQSLQQAMARQLGSFSRVYGIAHSLRVATGAPDPLVDAVIFRVLQEALANVQRHARASRVDVDLARSADACTLTVRDNGGGLPAGAAPGCGLRGMRERAAACGGSVVIDSALGHGSTITLILPIGCH